MGLDPLRLSRTLAWLLRYAPSAGGLVAGPDGWFSLEAAASAAARSLRRPVRAADVVAAAATSGGGRFQVEGDRIRAVGAGPSEGSSPDILYHAVPRTRLATYLQRGMIAAPHGGQLHLSRAEGHAWRIAWRHWDDPAVLFVDAARARRDGLRFIRSRSGQFVTPRIPTRHVLNLRDGFAEQASAGGFLVDWSAGTPRVALIKVNRRTGSTWEVAKGKIEAGEAPDRAAVREVGEEMGIREEVAVTRSLGTVRYGFSTPEGHPRLKTIYLYVLETGRPIAEFHPSEREGIEQVRWFDLFEAVEMLTHPSLRGVVGRLLAALDDRAEELGLKLTG